MLYFPCHRDRPKKKHHANPVFYIPQAFHSYCPGSFVGKYLEDHRCSHILLQPESSKKNKKSGKGSSSIQSYFPSSIPVYPTSHSIQPSSHPAEYFWIFQSTPRYTSPIAKKKRHQRYSIESGREVLAHFCAIKFTPGNCANRMRKLDDQITPPPPTPQETAPQSLP